MLNQENRFVKEYNWSEFVRIFSTVIFIGLGLIILITSNYVFAKIVLGIILLGGYSFINVRKKWISSN